uniref:Uncharacterized protein n=1 Tax=Rhizophora mucronata TaxID=61149 RepID=A0A2P2PER8_RHIMU
MKSRESWNVVNYPQERPLDWPFVKNFFGYLF